MRKETVDVQLESGQGGERLESIELGHQMTMTLEEVLQTFKTHDEEESRLFSVQLKPDDKRSLVLIRRQKVRIDEQDKIILLLRDVTNQLGYETVML